MTLADPLPRRLTLALVAVLLVPPAALPAGPPAVDLGRAVVLTPRPRTGPEAQAVRMLIEEVEKRSRIRWDEVRDWPAKDTPVLLVGGGEDVRRMAAGGGLNLPDGLGRGAAEGYRIGVGSGRGAAVVWVAGNDARGTLFGVGRLLRALRMERDAVHLAADFRADSAPRLPLRGHQIGYRPKTNSYDGWTVALWEQYLRDLAVFGCNAVELIPPRSDDAADSPLFPLPPLRMMTEVSRLADAYGLDVWVWYPAMDPDYSDPATVERALNEWAEVFRALPRLDAVFVPGGDPGHTRPKVFLALLEKQAANLRRFHPKAQLWASPQSFNQAWMDEFLDLLKEEPPWLAGVVYGPQVRLSLADLRRAVPRRYPIRNYPDITHSRHCQYPVPDWDLAFALTEGREMSNPRPLQTANIFRLCRPYTAGFITYSEGCHDDVNKCVWSALGWDERADVREVLREYARYFIGPAYEERFADGLLALEKNWEGPVLDNGGIDATLADFRAMEKAATPAVKLNWRFQQALYRAYYDGYLRARLRYEHGLETAAVAKLGEARLLGSRRALDEAEALLDRATKEPVAQDLRARVFELAEALFQSIRAQLSVERYQAIAVERGANLDMIDCPLTNAGWLKARFTAIRALPDEAGRLRQIEAILKRTDPGPGGFYDDLGDPLRQPHLVRSVGWKEDPEFRASSLVGFGFRSPGPDRSLPVAWLQHAESLFGAPLRVRYTGLDPRAAYRVRVVYGREGRGTKIKLVANDRHEVHGYLNRSHEPLEFAIPAEATAGGELTLSWTPEPGGGGAGRGCQVAEVWLLKKSDRE
jgi:hypothetical protein